MKRVLLILVTLAAALAPLHAASRSRTPAAPSPELHPALPEDAAPTAAEIRATIVHMQELARDTQRELDTALQENASLKISLLGTQTAIESGQAETAGVRKELDDMRRWGVAWQVRAEHAEAEVGMLTALVWRWRLYFFGLVALIVGLFLLRNWLRVQFPFLSKLL